LFGIGIAPQHIIRVMCAINSPRVGMIVPIIQRLAVLTVVAAACCLLTDCSHETAKSDRLYKIGYGDNFPYHFQQPDGTPSGLAVDLVRKAAQRRGIRLEWKHSDAGGMSSLLHGETDFWVLLTILPERVGRVHFTEPFLLDDISFLVPARPQPVTLADLKRSRIALMNIEIVRQSLKEILPDAVAVDVHSPREALESIAEGRADAAYLYHVGTVMGLLAGGPVPPIRVLSTGKPPYKLALASTFQTRDTADQIRDELRTMATDGTAQRISDHWSYFASLTSDAIDAFEREQVQNRALRVSVILLFALLAALGILAIRLRRQRQIARMHESNLRVSEERWELAVKGTSDGIWDQDLVTGEVHCSDRWKEMLGYTPDELQVNASTWKTLIHPDDFEQADAILQKHMRGETDRYMAEYRMRTKSGDYRWMLVRGMAQRDASGRPVRFTGVQTDITERRLAEEALKKSEERFAAVFRSSPVSMVLSDVEDGFRILDVNRIFERGSGYSRGEVIGKRSGKHGLWADPDRETRIEGLFVREGGVQNQEFEFRRKDGTIRTGLISAHQIEIQGRKCAIATVLDITESRRMQNALKESEALYRLLAGNISDVIWILDCDDIRFRYVSPSVEQLAGFTADQVLALFTSAFTTSGFSEAIGPALRERVESFRRGAKQTYTDEIELPRNDGSRIWIEIASRYGVNEQSGHVELYGVARDITERKRHQDELEWSQQKLRESTESLLAVANCVPDTIFSMDLSGRITYLSPAVQRMYGWTPEEGLAMNRRDFGTSRQFEAGGRLLETELLKASLPGYDRNHVFRATVEHKRKDGSVFWAEMTASFDWSNEGKPVGVTGVVRDVTERKQAEEEREKLSAQLAQAQKMESIGRLAGGVAHDFNNLLTIINGYSDLALGAFDSKNPLHAFLEEIYEAGKRAAALTRQLLAFSRKQVLEPKTLDLNRVVEDMRSMLRRLVGEDVAVRFNLAAESPRVHADPHQLQQVVMNLAVNARDAMPTGGTLLIDTSLVQRKDPASVDGAATQPYALLAVGDTGIGMDEATKERIFEPFFTTKGTGKGTGLGLSMVHGIVEQSGGFIEVLSQPGRGTTFKIYLPAMKGPPAEDREAVVATQDYRGKESILVVEDQAEVREYVVAALKRYGYRVIPAPNAGEALLIFEREGDHIDLVLTDVVMPYSSGFDLAKRLKTLRRRVKILFMSGYADDVLERHGVAQEGTAFINKPFTPQELAVKVRSVIAPAATAARILIADHNAGVRSYLRVVLASTGYTVAELAGGQADVRAALAQPVDVLVMDVAMMDPCGEMIRTLRRDFPGLGIILISGALAGESSLDLEALGADAVLSKPISPALFLSRIAEVLAIQR